MNSFVAKFLFSISLAFHIPLSLHSMEQDSSAVDENINLSNVPTKNYAEFIEGIAKRTSELLRDCTKPIMPKRQIELEKLFRQMKFATIYGVSLSGAVNNYNPEAKFLCESAGNQRAVPINDPRVVAILKVCENFARFSILMPALHSQGISDFFCDKELYSLSNLHPFTESEFSRSQRIMLEYITFSYYSKLLHQHASMEHAEKLKEVRIRQEKNFQDSIKYDSDGSVSSGVSSKSIKRATGVVKEYIEAQSVKFAIPEKPSYQNALKEVRTIIDNIKRKSASIKSKIPAPISREQLKQIQSKLDDECEIFSRERQKTSELEDFEKELTLEDDKLSKCIAILLTDQSNQDSEDDLKKWAIATEKRVRAAKKSLGLSSQPDKQAMPKPFQDPLFFLDMELSAYERVLYQFCKAENLSSVKGQVEPRLLQLLDFAFAKFHRGDVEVLLTYDMLNNTKIYRQTLEPLWHLGWKYRLKETIEMVIKEEIGQFPY